MLGHGLVLVRMPLMHKACTDTLLAISLCFVLEMQSTIRTH